jgi:hypothetical protein
MFNGIAAISLLLCVASVIFWVRGSRVLDELNYGEPAPDGRWRHYIVLNDNGEIEISANFLQFQGVDSKTIGARRGFHYGKQAATELDPWSFNDTLWNRLGFWDDWNNYIRGQPGRSYTSVGMFLYIPCWFVSTATAIIPTAALFMFARKRKQWRTGLCANCGYNLRATPDRCPECGMIPPKMN